MSKQRSAIIAALYLISILSLLVVYFKSIQQSCSAYVTVLKQTEESTTTTASALPRATATQDVNIRYVTLGKIFNDGRGLGNQVFDVAMLLFVSEMTGRLPAFVNVSYITNVEETFDLKIPRYEEQFLRPWLDLHEFKPLMYDKKFEELGTYQSDYRTIHLHGFFQSWKYVQSVDRILQRHLVFKGEIKTAVESFFARNVPTQWSKNFIRVGIHVRRGDVLAESKVKIGRTNPNVTYFERAMTYFMKHYSSRVQFIVVSNDLNWCRENFDRIVSKLNKVSPASNINVTYSSRGHTMGLDLALLANCNHVIISTGTFGWWAAWLAKGTTVYFADWPRNGSTFASWFRREDYFPPWWIGMV